MRRVVLVLATVVSLTLFLGCDTEEVPGGPPGGKVGDPCKVTEDCALTLVCAGDGTCQQSGSKGTGIQGDGCGFNNDCVFNLICSSSGHCTIPGTGTAGSPCVGNQDCSRELLCSSAGSCAHPGDPGAKGLKEQCLDPADCALGLVCIDDLCTALSYWAGVECADDDGPLRSYFEIPRSGETVTEFYRLPFPNDIRLKGGKIDLTGHPNPGTALPAEYGDVVGSYLKAISEDVTGFGLNTAVLFRMSKAFDLDSLKTKLMQIVNIDKSSPDYGQSAGFNMWATTGRGKYICYNHVAIRPTTGRPLAPLTTYAVLLKTGIADSDGTQVQADADFKLVLADTAPTDPDENAAWKAYEPLRLYLKDKGISPNDLINAAVFTTMDPRARIAQLRQAIHDQAVPQPSQLTLCDGVNKSPCDDGKETSHKCPTVPDAAFHEIQGHYQTPIFQKGTKPYLTPKEGGGIQYDFSGKPVIQGKDDLCLALTIPKATMPAEGWPVVIFAHGTGGSYRSFINNGTAAALADVKDSTGAVSRMAVISIDGAMHGPRRGSTDKPDDLFFNIRNPRAARDNTYQGAADKFELVRLVKALNLDTTSSPTGEAIKLDPNKIYFFGHSQGTIEGIPFLAFEPDVKATVLSGAGGYLLGSLLWKSKPVNVAGLVQLALADGNVNTSHPFLNLLQLFFEEVDAVNYGRAIFYEPASGLDPKHTFLGYGISDSFTPPATINALAWSMAIRQVKQAAQRCGDGVCNGTESCKSCEGDCDKCPAGTTCGNGVCEAKEKCYVCAEDCDPCDPLFPEDDPPVTENVTRSGQKVTAAVVQYVSDGSYDDHFVLFDNPKGRQQSTHFLGTAARDGSPTIPAAQ